MSMVQRNMFNGEIDFSDTGKAFSHLSNKELKKSLILYYFMNNGILGKYGPRIIQLLYKWKLPVSKIIKPLIYDHFCGGETFESCKTRLKSLKKHNIKSILIYAVEGKAHESEFENSVASTLKCIEFAAENRDTVSYIVFKPTGIASIELLEKKDAGKKLTLEEQEQYQKYLGRIEKISERAYEKKVRLYFDAEETWIQNGIDQICLEMMKRFNRESAIIYNTYQLYRNDKLKSLESDIQLAKSQKFFLGAKLVRGAYLEQENLRAEKLSYSSQMQVSKANTDRDFDLAIKLCLENKDQVYLSCCTHNEKSTKFLIKLLNDYQVPKDSQYIDFAQLLGMSDNQTYLLAQNNFNVSKYVPFGPVKEVIPYLMRRAQENTSVRGQTNREAQLIKKELLRRKESSNH